MVQSRLSTIAALLVTAVCAAPSGCGADPTSPSAEVATPSRLSETGLYRDFGSRALAPDVIHFAPANPLWADGSRKERYLLLPPGSKIDTRDMDNWVFPVGTKAWKEFWVGGRLVETRLLWKRRPEPGIASWSHVAYVWTPDGSDATPAPEGVPTALGTTHDVPSQTDCMSCHLYARDAVIGFSAIELSTPSASVTADVPTNAPTGLLLPLAEKGLFTTPPTADFAVPGTGVVRDALAYLHGNCGFCHNDRMLELISRSMRFQLRTNDTAVENTAAYTTSIRAKMFHEMEDGVGLAIVPGEPERSQVYRRMVLTDLGRMPPTATKVVDTAGSALIRDWILQLPP